MRSIRRFGFAGASLYCALMLSPQLPSSDKAEVIKRARAMYYNLPSQGVKEFRCLGAPDWKKFLASNPNKTIADDALLRRLNLVKFVVQISVTDEPKVTPSTLGAIVLDDDLMRLIDGVKGTIQGFFMTWRGFVIMNPLDGCEIDSLEAGPDDYRISSKVPGLEAKTVMSKDFTITEVLADYRESKVRIAPKFTVTSNGLLLESINNEIDGGKTQLLERIEYAQVEGLRLPGKVHVDTTVAEGRFVIDIAFEDYQVKKR